MSNLYIDSVAHRYGENKILNNVYLSCDIGEITGLLGRNGSGKSTLLKIMFGSVKPDYMHMKLDGQIVDRAYLTRQISYLPQDFFIPDYLKIRELVDIYTFSYREELRSLPFISENENRALNELSSGQRRMMEFLLILHSDSRFILLDEPFSQLSPIIIDEIKEQLKKFKSRKAIILTDHYYEHILEVSDKIVLLHNRCNYSIRSVEDLQLHGYVNHLITSATNKSGRVDHNTSPVV